jgi:hypothetical protein
MDKPIAKLKLLTTKGEVIDAILYCHQETTTIAGTTYYFLQKNISADASGTTLSASTGSVARVVWGKFVYPLTGIAKILASTIYATYRAYTGGGTVNAEIDILIRQANGTVRTTIATGVSKSTNLGSSWATYTGANYSFAEYTVVDQTDYLEIDYIANVTAKKATQYAYLRIDDNTLNSADQTRSQEWKFTGVTTLSATNITINSATLNGQINGTETLTIRGFEWGTQSGNYTDSWTESGTFPPDTFSYNLTNLSRRTTYYFRAKAYSDATGWIYGNEVAFTTLSIFPVDWSYRKSHVINPASGAGTNYQVRIVAHYGSGTDSGEDVYLNGKCRTDFGDIRFTRSDGVSLLDYWMESKVDGDYAVFWVEVADDLSTNPVTIYIYYGNANVTTTSNGDATFPFFDDFDGSALNPDKWSINAVNSITYTVADGKLQITDATKSGNTYWIYNNTDTGSQHQAKYGIVDNVAVEWLSEFPVMTAASDMGEVGLALVDANNLVRAYLFHQDDYGAGIVPYRAWIYETTFGEESATGGETVKFKMTRTGTTVKFYVNDVLKATGTLTGTPAKLAIAVGAYGGYTFAKVNILTLWTRKYVEPEPSHGSWGSEETVAVAEAIVAKNFPMDYLPSPAKAAQLTSKVSGATITTVSQDYPLTLIKKDKAQELMSKFSAT